MGMDDDFDDFEPEEQIVGINWPRVLAWLGCAFVSLFFYGIMLLWFMGEAVKGFLGL